MTKPQLEDLIRRYLTAKREFSLWRVAELERELERAVGFDTRTADIRGLDMKSAPASERAV